MPPLKPAPIATAKIFDDRHDQRQREQRGLTIRTINPVQTLGLGGDVTDNEVVNNLLFAQRNDLLWYRLLPATI